MDPLDNAWYCSWRSWTDLNADISSVSFVTFNVATIFFRGHPYIWRMVVRICHDTYLVHTIYRNQLIQGHSASTVCLVSTRLLLPSPMACLASPISAYSRWMPTQRPPSTLVTCWTWEMAANNVKELSLPPNNCPWTILVSQASSVKPRLARLANIRKPKPVLYHALGRKARYSSMWNFFIWEALYWPKNCLRNNFIASRFPKFWGGACP